MTYKNHLKIGSDEKVHRNKKVITSLFSRDFEESVARLRNLTHSIGVIPPGYEHRADLIANLFYGSPTLDWVVLWTNNISDPFQQLNVGDRIKIVDLV